MYLSILSPDHKLFEGEVTTVTLPGYLGPFQVCKNHAPIVSSLVKGNVTYALGKELFSLAIKNGFACAANNQVTIGCEPLG